MSVARVDQFLTIPGASCMHSTQSRPAAHFESATDRDLKLWHRASIRRIASGFAALAGGRRTIGYRLEESAVPVGRPIFVLGEAVDSGGRLRIGKPAKKGASFIVSLKSEEQLESGAKALTSGLLIAAIVSAALGVAALIFGVVKG